ncbi:MAG TPA: hypothetical protein VF941_05770 [Clostridia bacterium]
MSKNNPIVTELGMLEGRDGFYLDDVIQSFSPNKLTFIGEINGKLCTNNPTGHKWFTYELSFNLIQAFDCRELEICKWKVESSFDEIQDSELITELGLCGKGYQHYTLSTYDYMYSIIAKGYELKITGGR